MNVCKKNYRAVVSFKQAARPAVSVFQATVLSQNQVFALTGESLRQHLGRLLDEVKLVARPQLPVAPT